MRSIEAIQHPSLLENRKEEKLFGSREGKGESVAWQVSASSHTFRCCLYRSLSGVFGKAPGYAGGYLLASL